MGREYCKSIIKQKTVEKYISLYPSAEAGLRGWLKVNQKSTFSNIMALKKAYPSAENIIVKEKLYELCNGERIREIHAESSDSYRRG
jgi:mRNA-degrading endonuclease HigB of HigAB toxin-antitoxin module